MKRSADDDHGAGEKRQRVGVDAPSSSAAAVIDRVKSFELFKVRPRWQLLRLETEQGVVGWGEPNCEGALDVVAAAVRDMMPAVLGEDVSRITLVWHKLYTQRFYSGGPILMSALAGIDQALWDIAGKTLGVPVHRLLGGAVRDRLKVYRWCGGDDNTPEECAREVRSVLASTNYKQIKMMGCARMGFVDGDGSAVRAAVARMKAVREAVGPDVGVALDFHGRLKAPMARKMLKALEPYDPLFFEEPLGPEQSSTAQLQTVAASTSVPIACGERLFTVHQFRELLERRSVGILQPDCSHAGGITNLLAIARMAEAYEVGFAPHCPLGPLALAGCLQVDACAINFVFQEVSLGAHFGGAGSGGMPDLLDYVKNKGDFDVDEDGHIKLLSRPGLGVEIDEERVRREHAAGGADWSDTKWSLPDGCPTTW